MRTFLRFERRFLPVPVHRLALATFALAFVCATSSAAAQRVETKFDMEFPNGNDTSLISEVETFVTGKYITNTFSSDIRDGLVQVNWKDKNGGTLLTGVDDQTLIIGAPEPGVIASATFWSSRLGAGIFAIKTREADGVGDFTGSHTSISPCLDLKCPAKYLEPVPSSEGVDRSGRLRASTTENAAAGPIVIGETEGRLGARQYTSPPTVNPNAFTPIFLLTFASKAEQNGSEYIYTYTVTNESETRLKFNWAAAGLSGELDASTSTSRSFVSALAPTATPSLATAVLGGFDAGGGLDLMAPVPEPSQLVFVLAGAALFAYRLRRSAGMSISRT